jgi:hypothetical protein
MACKGKNEVSKIRLPYELVGEQILKARKRTGRNRKIAIHTIT